MYFIWNVYAAVLLRTSVQILVSASLDHVEEGPEISADKIVNYVILPWMERRDWLLHPSESSRANEVRAFVRGVESGETWALEMLGALRKIEKEILQRNIQKIGTHDQSIMVNAQHNHVDIRKRSCEIISPGILSMISGRRSDSGISSSVFDALSKDKRQVTQIVHNAAQRKPLTSESDLGASGSLFPRLQLKDLAAVEIATILFILTTGVFMIGCTICDVLRRINHPGEFSETVIMLSKFSLYTNALALLSTKVTPDVMPAIHGIRFLSCCSVIISHRYFISIFALGKSMTLLDFLKGLNSWIGVYTEMVPYAVDTFFVISGFLTAHLFLKSMQSGTKFNLPKMYLHRYVRTTPCLGALILFTTIFSHRAGSGPLWETTLNYSVNHCTASWWLQLLYIQNLVKDGFLCLGHTWSLAVDMQLFWITRAIILYPLHRWPKIGLGVLSLFFATSLALPAAIVAIYGYSNTLLRLDTDASRWLENFQYYYIPTYIRACPYLVGIILGYDVATKRRHLTQVNVVVNWLVAGILLLLCVWFSHRTYNTNFAYNSYLEIGSAALLRPSWAFAMAWIIYACTQGYGGMATRFLSSPIFFPLSRLSFAIYLIHPCLQAIMIMMSPLETSADYLGFEIPYRVCVDLVVSIVGAFVINLFIESPVIILAKILMNHGGQGKRTTPVEELQKKRT